VLGSFLEDELFELLCRWIRFCDESCWYNHQRLVRMTSCTETWDRDLWPVLIVSANLEPDCTVLLYNRNRWNETHSYEETC
jgi:hypothetical protein